MREQVVDSGNTLILYSAYLLFFWYINQGKVFHGVVQAPLWLIYIPDILAEYAKAPVKSGF